MTTTGERRFGRDRIDLAALSDAELERELRDRRAKRGVTVDSASTGTASADTQARRAERDALARHYASLELAEGAPRADVERAYARLHAKYAPYTRSDNAERRAAAEHLLRGLLRARDALLRALKH